MLALRTEYHLYSNSLQFYVNAILVVSVCCVQESKFHVVKHYGHCGFVAMAHILLHVLLYTSFDNQHPFVLGVNNTTK